jgi:hypothetical protein
VLPPEDEATEAVRAVMDQLTGSPWDVCLVGRQSVDGELDPCHHALAFHRRAFDRLLAELPAEEADLDEWLEEHRSLNAYLRRRLRDGSFQFVGG